MYRFLILFGCLFSTGCSFLPEIYHEPTIHNPLPQLSKVAVAPFFNLSNDPTLDGRQVALAYYGELQAIPGFEVIPVNVVERAIQDNRIAFRGPEDARRLAQILDADAVVIGAVTDYAIWYPPRLGLQVEWYAANPGFHPIPPGYGLPWGTLEEEEIPGPLVREAEFALAKAQLATQTPDYQKMPPVPPVGPAAEEGSLPSGSSPAEEPQGTGGRESSEIDIRVRPASHASAIEELPPSGIFAALSQCESAPGFPPDWPNPQGFIPPPPRRRPPRCRPSNDPVIRHTRIYSGNDTEFTAALVDYYRTRDDARFGGWQSFLERSEDFIRFCCHMHIAETLVARGGAGETRVVWRWPTIR